VLRVKSVMSEACYEVIFRGDVLAGQPVVEVKQRLGQLFNADAARIDQMFSGKPVVVKRNVDLATAERYQSSLLTAGALVDIRPSVVDEDVSEETPLVAPVVSPESGSGIDQEAPSEDDPQPLQPVLKEVDFDVAPVGSDVLSAADQKDFIPVDIDTSYLNVAEEGADVLADEDKNVFVARDVDTSSLSISDPD